MYVVPGPQPAQPLYPVQPGQVPPQTYPQAAAVPAAVAAKTPMSPKKRTTIIVVAVVAVIAIIVAVAFGVKASADTRAKNIDGTYSFTPGDYSDDTINLSVTDGHFSITTPEYPGSNVSGSVDKGTISGDSVTYELTDITMTADGETKTLPDLLSLVGVSDDGIMKDEAKGAAVQLTIPKGATRGNVIGTWELSIGLMGIKAGALTLTVGQGNTFTYSQQAAGTTWYDQQGHWSDFGNGHYTLYDTDGDSIVSVTMQH